MSHNVQPASSIDVVIVEDNPVTMRALCLSIASEPTFNLVATFESVKPALSWLEKNAANVLLTDLGLPDGSGIEIIRACRLRHPKCDIMVLTVSSDEVNVLACIAAGASGYLLKNESRIDIVNAVLNLCAGGAPMSPVIARMVLERLRSGEFLSAPFVTATASVSLLSKREVDILDLIARGNSYGDVAKSLSLGVGTVQTHIKSIYGKLSVHSSSEAVFEAKRQGLLPSGTV